MVKLKTWKTIAIIFIILFIFAASNIINNLIIKNKLLAKENKCKDVCEENQEVGFYQYDPKLNDCSCVNQEGETIFQIKLIDKTSSKTAQQIGRLLGPIIVLWLGFRTIKMSKY